MAIRKTNDRDPSKSRFAWMAAIGVLIIVILALAAFGYKYYKDHKTVATKSQTQSQPQAVVPVAPTTTSSGTSNYVSNGKDLNLSFSYPTSWTVTPDTNSNPSDQTITLTTPLFTVTNSANKSVTAKVVIQIRPQSATLAELNANSPIESIASAQIGYTHPTSTQDQYPYLSYIHFNDSPTVTGAFEEVMITGGQNFTQGSPVSTGYLNGLDPVVSATFYQCSTQTCSGTGQTRLSIINSTWQNQSTFEQVLATFQSLKLN